MAGSNGALGGVDREAAHGHDIARAGGEDLHRAAGDGTGDITGDYAAKLPRPGNDLERAVVLTTVVDVQPQRHHADQQLGRWLDVVDATLAAPRAVALDLDTLPHGDGTILMPGHRPVSFRRLVEKKDADTPTERTH